MYCQHLTTNSHGNKVLTGSAEVKQPTVYLFTRQGSQKPGILHSSPAARAVWDGADTHLLATYGFCQQYTYDKKGNVKTLPLFVDINNQTPRYTFSHPTGLIFATRFAQIALVVIEKAAFDDMRSKGFIQNRSAFAGHSLGEYSAPASITHVLERNFQNRSNYAMCVPCFPNSQRCCFTYDLDVNQFIASNRRLQR